MPQGKGGGRPVRQKGSPLSKTQTFRLSELMDSTIRAAAAESKRSISEEIQFRLEESFKMELAEARAENVEMRRHIESLSMIIRHSLAFLKLQKVADEAVSVFESHHKEAEEMHKAHMNEVQEYYRRRAGVMVVWRNKEQEGK
jgi:hypothetical protein